MLHLEHLNVQSFITSVRPPHLYCGSLPVTTMTSADFLRIETESIPRPPLVRAFSFVQSLRHLHNCSFVFFGRYNECLLTRTIMPPYSVSVRQYRILQSRFLQCKPHGKPPCDLLMLRARSPRIRDLHPLEKSHTPLYASRK